MLCYDGSEAAERAIRTASVLVGRGREARVLGSASREVVNAYNRPVVLV